MEEDYEESPQFLGISKVSKAIRKSALVSKRASTSKHLQTTANQRSKWKTHSTIKVEIMEP
jgi:hypothetical protein